MSDKNRVGTVLLNSLCVLTDIANEQTAKHICTLITEGELTECSLSMRCFKYDALLKVDKCRYADFVLSSIKSDYLKMAKETGTVWETDLGYEDFDGAGSLCHGWSSLPIYYYHKLK